MLKFNSYRQNRYSRTRFVEGKYLLASDASDIELELSEALRKSIESTLGTDIAIDDAWKVTRLSATQLLVSPGDAFLQGLPVRMRSGKDQLVSGAILAAGIVPTGVVFSDEANGLGKVITFNSGSATPTNTYKISITVKEELLTDIDDPFLQNANLTESTAQKIRLLFQINLVPASLQTETPIPYRDESSVSASATNFPNAGGFAAPNLINNVIVTPTASGNGELISLNLITGSEKIDGRDLELIITNNPSIGAGIILPNSPTGQQAFSNGKLTDSNGNVYHINQIFNDTISTQLVIRIDKEPDQPNPEILNTKPYTLSKRQVYVTDDVNGSPQGKLYWTAAAVDFNTTDGLVHSSKITDLRNKLVKAQYYQKLVNQKLGLQATAGGLVTWALVPQMLSWAATINLINAHGTTQTIAAGQAPLLEGGTLHYKLNMSGGAIEKGTLAINVSAFGATSSLSAIALDSVEVGNIVEDSAGVLAEITAIDDINNTITTSPALTANGVGTIYMDSYGPGKAPLSELSYILAVRSTNKAYVSGTEFENNETGQIGDGGISQQNLAYMGATSESDDSPVYSSNTFVLNGDDLTTAIGKLDSQVGVASTSVNQDRTNKMIKGGTWSWDLATNTLTCSANAFIQVASLSNDVNQINAQSIVLSADAEVAYLQLKRTAGASVRSVSVGLINTLTMTNDLKIIARRVGNDVLVGESFLLKDGELLELDGSLAEINRLLGLLKLKQHPTAIDKVKVGVSSSTLLDNAQLSQLIGDFLLSFDGAVINFSTGAVLKADDSTALGNNFTPFAIPAGQYFWYGVSLTPSTVLSDNVQEALIQIDLATAASATQNLAPKPNITSDIKLGAIQVYNNSGSIEVVKVVRLGVGSGSGSGSGSIKAKFLDPMSTALPSGVSVTIDGVVGANDDLVLFTNLSSGNNRIYKLGGVGVALTWTAVRSFKSALDPLDGDSVRITAGNAFQEQLATFDGTNFKVNDVIRLFDGVSGNFWELGSIKTVALANNTTANIFSVPVLGSENFTIDYSIVRSTFKKAGQLFITSNGTTASITDSNSYIGDVGIVFNATISTGNLVISYTSSNSGSAGTMKLFTKRWSDAAGGPTGIPSYSGAGGGGAAGGNNTEVQFNNSGTLAGDANFKWDGGNSSISLNGLKIGSLSGSLTINDNQLSNLTILTYPKSTFPFSIIEYSVVRGGENRVGRILLSNNGTIVGFSDDFVETTSVGVTFAASISGANVILQYTSTSTGSAGIFKYSIRRWA